MWDKLILRLSFGLRGKLILVIYFTLTHFTPAPCKGGPTVFILVLLSGGWGSVKSPQHCHHLNFCFIKTFREQTYRQTHLIHENRNRE